MSAVTPCLNGGLLANRLLKRAGTSGQSQTGAEVGAVPGRWRRVGGRRGQPCAASSITAGMGMHGQSIARTGGRSGSSRGLRLRGWVVVDNSGAVETDTAEAATLDEALVAGAAMAAPVTPASVPAIDVPLATPLTTALTAAAAAAADGLKTKVSGKATGEASAHAGAATGRAVASQLRGVGAARGGLLGCDRVVDVSTAALPRLQRLDKGSKFPVLFYAPEMEDLARKVVKEEVGESTVELGSINWRNFPDGFPDLFVNDAYGVRDRHVAFLASFHSPEVIFEQISIIYSLPKMFVASFTLILPFFPTGTSERVENEGEIATAVTLARILSHIPPSRGGPCSTLIFDIHALQERFYFGDNVLPCFESGIPLLLARLAQCDDAANIVIAYPDEGAWKRFHGFFKGMEEVVCTKVRDGDKRIVKLKEGDPAGRHVVVVDDLVQSGGTLIECQRLLSRLGAIKVSAYVTHGVFPGNSWRRFTASSGAGGQGFHKFFLTDSCPGTAAAVAGIEPFEILSLARPIAEALHV